MAKRRAGSDAFKSLVTGSAKETKAKTEAPEATTTVLDSLPTAKETFARTQIYLRTDQIERLDALASDRDLSRSDLIRFAIDKFFENIDHYK